MARIRTVDVDVPGQIVRNRDVEADVTTLTMDEDQVRAIHAETGRLVEFFDQQGSSVPSSKPNPDEPTIPGT